jgi:hypothetical protein
MASLTSAILDALFPGEREKRAMWLRHAGASRPQQRTTLPPPVPVAGVSDSMPPPLPSSPPKRPSSKHRLRKA